MNDEIYGMNIYLKKNIINISLTIDKTINGSMTLNEARDMILFYFNFFRKYKNKRIKINYKIQ